GGGGRTALHYGGGGGACPTVRRGDRSYGRLNPARPGRKALSPGAPVLDTRRPDVYPRAMDNLQARCRPGQVRDAILQVMAVAPGPLSVPVIEEGVGRLLGS